MTEKDKEKSCPICKGREVRTVVLQKVTGGRMYHMKKISYEEARKEFFENLLIHKHNQLAVWLRKHDHEKCSDLGTEISYIEDAMKALEKEATNDPCRIEPAD